MSNSNVHLNAQEIEQVLSKRIDENIIKMLSQEIGEKSATIARLTCNLSLVSNQLTDTNKLFVDSQTELEKLKIENHNLKKDLDRLKKKNPK